jgi:hypothetical protein
MLFIWKPDARSVDDTSCTPTLLAPQRAVVREAANIGEPSIVRRLLTSRSDGRVSAQWRIRPRKFYATRALSSSSSSRSRNGRGGMLAVSPFASRDRTAGRLRTDPIADRGSGIVVKNRRTEKSAGAFRRWRRQPVANFPPSGVSCQENCRRPLIARFFRLEAAIRYYL